MIQTLKRSLRLSLCWTAGGAAVLAAAALYAQVRYGSPRAPLILLQGDALLVTPPKIDLGELDGGEARKVTLLLRNLGTTPIDVVGCRTSCTCIVTSGVPFTLCAGEQREVAFSIRALGRTAKTRQAATIYVGGQCSGEVSVPIFMKIRTVAVKSSRTRASLMRAPGWPTAQRVHL